MDLKEIDGILNLASVASNFNKDYSLVKLITTYEEKQKDEIINGIIIKSTSLKKRSYLNVVPTKAAYFGLVHILVGDNLELNPTIQKTMSNIANFAGIDFVFGYGEKYDPKTRNLWSSILIRHGNNFFSSEIPFGDLVCLSTINNIPVYVRNVIFETHGQEFEDIKVVQK